MPRNRIALRLESLVIGLLSRLADCIIFVVGMTTSRYPCRPTKRKHAVLGLLLDMVRVGGAGTPWSPWPGVSRRHEKPEPISDLDARDMN